MEANLLNALPPPHAVYRDHDLLCGAGQSCICKAAERHSPRGVKQDIFFVSSARSSDGRGSLVRSTRPFQTCQPLRRREPTNNRRRYRWRIPWILRVMVVADTAFSV